jgi:hypothetical protein
MPLRRMFVVVLLGFGLCEAGWAAHAPRLILIVVADQMRADYIPRFETDFSTGGFKRLAREGVYFSSAAYDYGATKTGPGHALIGSGTYPSQNGIVGNEWFDRVSSRSVACGELAASPDGRTALRWFKGKSFAQRFHAVYPQGRIYGVSHKARSALLLGGPGQDNAFWWDDKQNHYRAFGSDPGWLQEGREKWPRPGKGGEDVDASIAAVALALVDAEHLGANSSGAPDVLAVSFSELDYVGHEHGPDAPETRMAVVQLDQRLGAFLAALEARLPRQDMLWVVTADHGVTPVPEVSRGKGIPAGRVRLPLNWRLGLGIVKAVSPPYLYLDEAAARKRGLSKEQAAASLRRDALSWEGTQAVYTEADILSGSAPAALRRSIDPGRSGDLYIVLKPNYIFSEKMSGTTHGQPTPDDQDVPLLFWGDGLHAHSDRTVVSPGRIAPTLLKILHVPADDLLSPLDLQAS